MAKMNPQSRPSPVSTIILQHPNSTPEEILQILHDRGINTKLQSVRSLMSLHRRNELIPRPSPQTRPPRPRFTFSEQRVLDFAQQLPDLTIPEISRALKLSTSTVSNAFKKKGIRPTKKPTLVKINPETGEPIGLTRGQKIIRLILQGKSNIDIENETGAHRQIAANIRASMKKGIRYRLPTGETMTAKWDVPKSSPKKRRRPPRRWF